jgi:lysophospholipid acyltransferase (LPLAT)-like uncharacterized protein
MKVPRLHDLAVGLLSRYLGLALRTTRWSVHGAEHLAPYLAGTPVILAFWHEHLPLMVALWTHARRQMPAETKSRVFVLISPSRDGRLIADIVRRFGLDVIDGSSSRRARAGQLAMHATLQAGNHVCITPDGPRGPRRQARPGAAQLAALSGHAILPGAAAVSRGKMLKSWDRMVLPLPFGRGILVCGPPITVAADTWRAATPDIEAALTRASTTAAALLGRAERAVSQSENMWPRTRDDVLSTGSQDASRR